MQIRPEQFEAFSPLADAEFVQSMVEHLRKEYRDADVLLPSGEMLISEIPTGTLQEMIQSGLARARRYGITTEAGLASFIVLMFVVSPNFDEHPVINKVLRDAKIRADSRIDALWDKTTEENWEAAQDDYSVSAWNLNMSS